LTGDRVERQFPAVLAADVAGYSRLIGTDEEGTLSKLKAVRKVFVDPVIASHRGHFSDTPAAWSDVHCLGEPEVDFSPLRLPILTNFGQ
jgi:class 3 adenylate cyclase